MVVERSVELYTYSSDNQARQESGVGG